jgi:hypothetical protein
VLALIRRDPKRAERTLEDLADLFRSLMGDARDFVRLSDEITLLERYAEIEQLRLGERLRITWELDAAPSDALLPPLILQPLLENAVYHGVEPSTEAGDVLVRIERRGDRVLARIENATIEAGPSARETAWRWRIFASGWHFSLTPRRGWTCASSMAAIGSRSRFPTLRRHGGQHDPQNFHCRRRRPGARADQGAVAGHRRGNAHRDRRRSAPRPGSD